MNPITNSLRILLSVDSRLFMSKSEYIAELATLLPYIFSKQPIELIKYKESAHKDFIALPINAGIKITDDFNSDVIEPATVAYHRISGVILSDENYRFSTKRLEQNLLQAEANENIASHFLHITSGGGEAWYIDRLAETMRSLSKPTFAHIEKVAASAGYYIASQTSHISASTPFDIVGSIGVMVGFMDIKPMLSKWGINFIEEYATCSDLKNKKYTDLANGKPEQYIEEELNPVRDKFVADVKRTRKEIARLGNDHPILRGETYHAENAVENGLIDTIEPIGSAIQRAYIAGVEWDKKKNERKKALQTLH